VTLFVSFTGFFAAMSRKELWSVVRRLQFVKLALKAQQTMSQLCRVFGISRKNGYKWKARFEREGPMGLRDRPRRPRRCPRQTAASWLSRIRRLRRRYPSWGSRKLAARLRHQFPRQSSPAARTIDKWLRRLKLNRRQRRHSRRGPTLRRCKLTVAQRSNHVWTVDFKGWFRTRDGHRVEPLTVRDLFSRYLLTVRLLPDQRWEAVRQIFLRLFRRYGYPEVIRADNGSPFGTTGPAGLSRLSAWWTALGIRVEFIAPGHPEQNGAHEQMHRIYKAEVARKPSANRRAQQRQTGRWVEVYNSIRPHEALQQRTPAQVYRSGRWQGRQLALSYPSHWSVRKVRSNGEIKWQGRKRFVGEAFAGYPLGLRLRRRGIHAVYFSTQLIGELWDSDPGGIRPAKRVRR